MSWSPLLSVAATLVLFPIACVKAPPAAEPTSAPAPAAVDSTAAPQPNDASTEAPEAPPDAATILARAVGVLGGKAAFDAIETYHSKATVTVRGQNLSTTVEVWWQADDFYLRSEMPGLGLAEIWKHGDVIWADGPMHGRRRLEGKQALQATLDATPSLLAHWSRYFDSAETASTRAVDGRALVDVQFSGPHELDITVGFDVEDGLPAMHAMVRDTPMGALPVTTWFDDYREVSGIQTPFRSVISTSMYESEVTVERFETGVPIAPGTFDP